MKLSGAIHKVAGHKMGILTSTTHFISMPKIYAVSVSTRNPSKYPMTCTLTNRPRLLRRQMTPAENTTLSGLTAKSIAIIKMRGKTLMIGGVTYRKLQGEQQ